MSHEEIMIVSKAHFDQVVLTAHNSSLKNDVGAVFVKEPSQGGFYHLCASLGHLLISIREKNSWRLESHQPALDAVRDQLRALQAAYGFDAGQIARALDMAAANLDFCVDAAPAEDAPSEMVISEGQRALMELQGKLRRPEDELRQYLLSAF